MEESGDSTGVASLVVLTACGMDLEADYRDTEGTACEIRDEPEGIAIG
ncbi:MAG: hypothetical protein ABW047_06915 [Nitrospiraceae bacterium]